MLYDIFDSGSCIAEFLYQHLVFDLFGRPRLLGATFTEFTEEVGAENVASLASIFMEIFRKKRGLLPAEILHLIVLMEKFPFEMKTLIRFHPVTVPLENRGPLVSREYEYLTEILKETDVVGGQERLGLPEAVALLNGVKLLPNAVLSQCPPSI